MKHIVVIGGGEIGRPGYPVETTDIDKQIISLSNKKNLEVLFVPTANSDSLSYYEVLNRHYGKPHKSAIEHAIDSADIIYVGGGNTLK